MCIRDSSRSDELKRHLRTHAGTSQRKTRKSRRVEKSLRDHRSPMKILPPPQVSTPLSVGNISVMQTVPTVPVPSMAAMLPTPASSRPVSAQSSAVSLPSLAKLAAEQPPLPTDEKIKLPPVSNMLRQIDVFNTFK